MGDFSLLRHVQARLWALQEPDAYSYWLYLATALGAGLLFLTLFRRKSVGESLKRIFSRQVWRGPSARADYWFFGINELLFRRPTDLVFITLVNFLSVRTQALFGGVQPLFAGAGSGLPVVILYTVYTLMVIDFASYVTHWLQHNVDFFWRFHKVHHSAERLSPVTVFRQHPLDMIQYTVLRGTFAGVGYSLFPLLFPLPSDVARFSGVNAGLFIYFLTASLRHSEVPFAYPKFLRPLFYSPHLHQIHHSLDERHTRSNYGVVFSLWDCLFKTYVDEEPTEAGLTFGLPRADDPFDHSIFRLYFEPMGLARKRTKVPKDQP